MMMPIAEGISQLKWYWFNEPQPLIDLDRFDTASRGPWGSLLLLFHTRKHYLASLGAFITIAALAVDPFSQQVLQYYDCLEPVAGSIARIPKTNRYSTGGMHTGAGSATLDGPTQVAIYMGLLNPPANSSASVSVDCSTGNCTFPADSGATFSTLGMCHSCTDISDTVSVNDTKVPVNYTLESGSWVGRELLASVLAQTSKSYEPLFDFEALMLNYPDNCTADGEGIRPADCIPVDPFAVHCSLRPCLQTYGANVTESVYTEELISSEELPFILDNGKYWVLGTDKTLENGAWSDCNATTHPTAANTLGIGPNGTLGGTRTSEGGNVTLYYPDPCFWAFNYSAAVPLREFLYGMFDGNQLAYYAVPTAIVGDLWLQNLYQNGSATMSTVDAYMTGFMNSLTANIRTRGETPSSGYVAGTPLASKTCIRVRWAWFALPSALWLLTVAFLAVLLLQSRFKAHGALSWQQDGWKSSILVPLFHGFDRDTLEKLRRSADADADGASPAVSGQGMQSIARQMRVELRYEESGLQFVDVSPGVKEALVTGRSEASLDESGNAQRDSLLVPDSAAPGAGRTSRPQSPISWKSVSPPA
ncbi:hypothetical protein MPH_05881 [Macrophomina phaseolina MS6]|uniref:Uncharacterized protein n=1 Tax=Macrophomina phaseolina (strain MS6) TaxID=1126212 RepID=K2SJ97_MACPH|nr:hypothetical protein MPH_05881 [Macrophomina phaseolina MS6]